MPEGPEVTLIANDLDKYVKGKKLTNIEILPFSKYVKKAPDNYQSFLDLLPLKVIGVKNKGKLMYWVFEKNNYMLNHLIMSGFWSREKERFASLCFEFNDGSKAYFCDARKFGYVEFFSGEKELKDKLSELGPDFMKEVKYDYFFSALKTKPRSNVCSVLMNQKLFSGIGNYLKSEILYSSKISPYRTINSLSDEDIKILFRESKKIVKLSYDNGGVSKKDYVHLNGDKGNFQDMLLVYGKTKDKLGNKILREKTKDNRTTYWVPEIQL